jgi:hypothetical protein
MKAEMKGKDLVITIPLEKPKPSKSGKSLVVCSSHGVQQVAVEVDGKPLYVVVNGFIFQ